MDRVTVKKLLESMKGTESRLNDEYGKINSLPRSMNMRELTLRENRLMTIEETKKLITDYVHKFDESVNTDWVVRQGKRISKALSNITNMADDSKVFLQYADYVGNPIDKETKAAKLAKSTDISNAILVEISI